MNRVLRLLTCAVLLSAGVVAFAQAAPVERLRLPSAADEIRARIEAEQLLRNGRGPERTLPGPVTDTEVVRVAVAPDGVPQRVTVDQRLRVDDVGDYFIKIPGPVEKAEALPDSTSQPGLRSGSLVWQGFSSESETLSARVELDPENETDRLPVAARLRFRVNDRASEVGDHAGGLMELELEVINSTESPMILPSATPAEPERVAGLLDSVRESLSFGNRPRAGRDFPVSLVVASPIANRRTRVIAPVSVALRVALDEGAKEVKGPHIRVERNDSRVLVTASTVLSAGKPRHTFRFTASVPAGSSTVGLRILPSAPPPSDLQPPTGKSWTGAYRRGSVSSRNVLDRLVSVLASVARLPEIDGYLGNPDRDGPARTTYSYRFVTPVAADQPPAGSPPNTRGNSALGIAAALALAAGLLLSLVIWWAVS